MLYIGYLRTLNALRVVNEVYKEVENDEHWHIHHDGGQILLCTAGRGYYQEWGKEARKLHPGDVVNIPPEVKHWHDTAPDS